MFSPHSLSDSCTVSRAYDSMPPFADYIVPLFFLGKRHHRGDCLPLSDVSLALFGLLLFFLPILLRNHLVEAWLASLLFSTVDRQAQRSAPKRLLPRQRISRRHIDVSLTAPRQSALFEADACRNIKQAWAHRPAPELSEKHNVHPA